MAEGGEPYSFRHSTLNLRGEQEKTEEERLRRRLVRLEEERRKNEDLERLIAQREQLIRQRQGRLVEPRARELPEAESFLTIDEAEETEFRGMDLSEETRLLENKLQELELDSSLRRQESTEKTRTSIVVDKEMEESLRRLEDEVFLEDPLPSKLTRERSLEDKHGSMRTFSKPREVHERVIVPEDEARMDSVERKMGMYSTAAKGRKMGKYSPTEGSGKYTLTAEKDDKDFVKKLMDLEELKSEMLYREAEVIQRERRFADWEQNMRRNLQDRESELNRSEERFAELQRKMKEKFEEMDIILQEKQKRLSYQQRHLEEEQYKLWLQQNYKTFREDAISETVKEDTSREKDSVTVQKKTKEDDSFNNYSKEVTNLNVKLNLTPFSGKEPVPKNESSFEEFKLEFESVRQIYSEQVLKQALRKCLKEQARKTMLHLGTGATVDDVLRSLEESFGTVASEDSILSRFLLAEQRSEESIVEWGLRLEDMLLQVCRKSGMSESERRDKLKNRFWRGLKSDELRQATRAYFDGAFTYEELRNKVRSEEYEIKLRKERAGKSVKTAKLNQTTADAAQTSPIPQDAMATLMKQIENLDKKIEDLKKSRNSTSGGGRPKYGGYRKQGTGKGQQNSSSKESKKQVDKKDTEGTRDKDAALNQ